MKEYRVAQLKAETRDAGAADPAERVLVGMPIVFDTPTLINDPAGGYYEIIERSALQGVELNDTRLLYNHDLTRVPLARAPKTMQLLVTEKGVQMRAVLADTPAHNDVYTAVKRGDLDGMSFAFKVPEGGDEWNRDTNTRTIHRIEKVYEVSVVAFPAYAQTSVEARAALKSLKDSKRDAVLLRLNKIMYKGVI